MHFYAKTTEGVKPKHFVENKSKGGLRPSRVTDAKKAFKNGEVWLPSVTTILNILDKPALVNWKVDKHLEQVHNLICNDVELRSDDLEGFKRLIKAQTQEALDSAPKAGTAIHNTLEIFIRDGIAPLDEIEQKICMNVVKVLKEHCGFDYNNHDFKTESYFADETIGYAGCADLVSDTWVIDYKSKQEASKFKPGKMAYPEHYRQLASYGRALSKTDFRAANIFVCLETGEVDFHEHSQEDLQKGWLDFLDCLSIYHRNTYNPLGE